MFQTPLFRTPPEIRMARFAPLALVFMSVACQPSDAWMDSGVESYEASDRVALERTDLDGNRAIAATVKAKISSRSGGEWTITYDLKYITKSWKLKGACATEADNITDEVGSGLAGCKITCNDLNEYQECNDCDIDCSSAREAPVSLYEGSAAF